jgi:hypothetical protein
MKNTLPRKSWGLAPNAKRRLGACRSVASEKKTFQRPTFAWVAGFCKADRVPGALERVGLLVIETALGK